MYNSKGDNRYAKPGTAGRAKSGRPTARQENPEAFEPDAPVDAPQRSAFNPPPPFAVFLSQAFTYLVIACILIGAVVALILRQFEAPGPLSYPTVFVVAHGEGISTTAKRLEAEKIIRSRWIFLMAVRYYKERNNLVLKAGEFNIKANASVRDLLDMLAEGKTVMYSVSIPEGLTSYQIVERLKADQDLSGDIQEMPAEGTLLPDTYRFAKGTSRQELIKRMQGEQKRFLEGLWAKRAPDLPASIKPEDVVNIAAIVEKEASKAEERAHVAAVYWNRLKKGMPLQADPTIIYGASNGRGTLGRGLLKTELEDEDNPYNTYRNKGLPPTAIAHPGRAALEAAFNPARSPDLYFVADGTGGHAFAESYADHLKNVAKWRKIEKERNEEQQIAGAGGGAAVAGTAFDKLQASDIPLPQRSPHR